MTLRPYGNHTPKGDIKKRSNEKTRDDNFYIQTYATSPLVCQPWFPSDDLPVLYGWVAEDRNPKRRPAKRLPLGQALGTFPSIPLMISYIFNDGLYMKSGQSTYTSRWSFVGAGVRGDEKVLVWLRCDMMIRWAIKTFCMKSR